MIDLKTKEAQAEAAELFRKDMNQPAIRLSIHRSFRKYADLRDQLIREYTEMTRLPEEFFHSVIAQDLRKDLAS